MYEGMENRMGKTMTRSGYWVMFREGAPMWVPKHSPWVAHWPCAPESGKSRWGMHLGASSCTCFAALPVLGFDWGSESSWLESLGEEDG